jgi:gamma-glutamyltranspeptidase / glutathione hydrolase
VAPGKRPRLTPNPALAIKGGDRYLPFGTPGGDVQIQATLQVLLSLFVFGADVQAAIEAPRFATYSFPSSFAPFDCYPGRLNLERRIPEPVAAELERRGHRVSLWPDFEWRAAAVCAILADPAAAFSKPPPIRAARPMRSAVRACCHTSRSLCGEKGWVK